MSATTPDRNGPIAVTQTVSGFFHAVETGDWAAVRAALADPVEVAHGPETTTMSAADLASGWQTSHARFAATQYRVTPVDIELTDDRAVARFRSQATLISDGRESAATVVDGHYTIDLQRTGRAWKIRSIHHDVQR